MCNCVICNGDRNTSHKQEEQYCLSCDGCGLLNGHICKSCMGHGVIVFDGKRTHQYKATQEQTNAIKKVGTA